MKIWRLAAVILLIFGGCKSKASGDGAVGADKPKIYSLEDVDEDLKKAGVQLNGTQEDVKNFIKAYPNYQVCQDTDYLFMARMRNSKIDPKVSDQYIVVAYREGKISNLEVGPPEFSVGNLPSYCH